jgi:hypothetical protein
VRGLPDEADAARAALGVALLEARAGA